MIRLRSLDLLRVAGKRKRGNDSTLNKLYYYYFLMKVLKQYHDSKFDIPDIVETLSDVTGVIYSELLYPVITKKEVNIFTTEAEEQEYNNYIRENSSIIESQTKIVENFMYIYEGIRLLLSLYVIRTKRNDFKDIKYDIISEAYKKLCKINISNLSNSYIRGLYSDVVNLYNVFLSDNSKDSADYLYMTRGINFKEIDITLALEEVNR